MHKNYGDVEALADVNFSLARGRIVGLLGPNASGKTTLIKIANGLLTPSFGDVYINDQKPSAATKAMVSYSFNQISTCRWYSATASSSVSFPAW